jgi:hypothetical protein
MRDINYTQLQRHNTLITKRIHTAKKKEKTLKKQKTRYGEYDSNY